MFNIHSNVFGSQSAGDLLVNSLQLIEGGRDGIIPNRDRLYSRDGRPYYSNDEVMVGIEVDKQYASHGEYGPEQELMTDVSITSATRINSIAISGSNFAVVSFRHSQPLPERNQIFVFRVDETNTWTMLDPIDLPDWHEDLESVSAVNNNLVAVAETGTGPRNFKVVVYFWDSFELVLTHEVPFPTTPTPFGTGAISVSGGVIALDTAATSDSIRVFGWKMIGGDLVPLTGYWGNETYDINDSDMVSLQVNTINANVYINHAYLRTVTRY